MHEFKAGDIVRLKTGGPNMVVDSTNGDGSVSVDWLDKQDEDRNQSFKPAQLIFNARLTEIANQQAEEAAKGAVIVDTLVNEGDAAMEFFKSNRSA